MSALEGGADLAWGLADFRVWQILLQKSVEIALEP